MAEIIYTRGDSFPKEFQLINKKTNLPLPIENYSFIMTINTERDPSDTDTPTWQLTGTVDDADDGELSFNITTAHTGNLGEWWYDIQMTDPNGNIKTIAKDKFIVNLMDVTK